LGKNRDNEQLEAIEPYIEQGLIERVLGVVKSGKEATVYCCEGGPASGRGLVAAKVYRSRNVRQFANDAAYQEGRLRGMERRRETRAILAKSRAGREMAFGKWVSDEYETLQVLHRAGVDVPEPIAHSGSVILMEYVGDENDPAPMLAGVRFEPAEAQRVFARLMRNVELALANDRVHGDLSAYNVLYRDGDVRIIDFPQAVDPRFNSNALTLLERDIERLADHFARFGVEAGAHRISRELWGRFLRSEL
jgi:RIO kinase 1